ncbi:MAG: RNA polymerase sigma factor [Chloroflexi bacterium]|nr:RNA polymerase sigma factor [Chloroflexota bacterium]
MAATDEQLALNVQQGDKYAMQQLVLRHADRLTGYLYRMVHGDRALAEDLLQETFLRVLRGIEGYTYPRPFKPWLYAIATNAARAHFRRADTRRTASHESFELHPSQTANPEYQLERSQRARRVTQALASLPDHQREAIILFYYEELTIAEIAAVLAIPEGTVKSRLSIARRRLRSALELEESTHVTTG